uniref:Protein tipE n=2 Tax=Cacopsylla melanoneura TaxID=428564 RepID=A0A8D8S4R4_9HEMI
MEEEETKLHNSDKDEDSEDDEEGEEEKQGKIQEDVEPEEETTAQKAKFYVSLCSGVTACLSAFAFLFLIPFIIEPAIKTIMADYESEPVTCNLSRHDVGLGISNCNWASCREGCTAQMIKCHQITVHYSRMFFKEYNKSHSPGPIPWDHEDIKFLINTEGCGYPPGTNCTNFVKQYGLPESPSSKDLPPKPFPCYYSKVFPTLHVVSKYNWDLNMRYLILALIVPIVLFFGSLTILGYWYCPRKSKIQPAYI